MPHDPAANDFALLAFVIRRDPSCRTVAKPSFQGCSERLLSSFELHEILQHLPNSASSVVVRTFEILEMELMLFCRCRLAGHGRARRGEVVGDFYVAFPSSLNVILAHFIHALTHAPAQSSTSCSGMRSDVFVFDVQGARTLGFEDDMSVLGFFEGSTPKARLETEPANDFGIRRVVSYARTS